MQEYVFPLSRETRYDDDFGSINYFNDIYGKYTITQREKESGEKRRRFFAKRNIYNPLYKLENEETGGKS